MALQSFVGGFQGLRGVIGPWWALMMEAPVAYCWLVGKEGMRYPISPYIYP